jgi:hypothetical protein
MMSVLVLLATFQDPLLGEQRINTDQASFYTGSNRISPVLRKAELGETVTVTAIEGRFAKVTLSDGKTAYVHPTALVAKEKFKVAASDDEQAKKLAAQGQEGQRGVNPETEAEHRKLSGPEINAAYVELDALMARPGFKLDRGQLEARLAEFRKAGKLGEFASVK